MHLSSLQKDCITNQIAENVTYCIHITHTPSQPPHQLEIKSSSGDNLVIWCVCNGNTLMNKIHV